MVLLGVVTCLLICFECCSGAWFTMVVALVLLCLCYDVAMVLLCHCYGFALVLLFGDGVALVLLLF